MKKVKIINCSINIKGNNVEGKDVTLDAKENLNITASETTNKLEQDSKSSSASVGVGFDLATGQVSSVTISGSTSKGEVDANSTSYNESTVKADKNLDFTSGKDTNIKGGKLSGEKVTGNVGGDLNIESKQDKNSYEEKNSSAGFGIGIDLSGQNKKDSQDNLDKKDKVNNANKTGIFGSAGKSDVDSKYESVTDQSGIYAGKEGFDINVGENTDLKGGIISSEAEKDKNKISTGTLTYEDIKNKAEYEAGSTGINVDTSAGAEHKDAGVTPNIGVGAKDDAESTTKATVSEGEIEIRDKENQKQDLAGLNRDTKNSLNKMGEIFDKTKVEERQELAGLFGEVAFNQIHYMKGTKEQKALYHALVGGIMSKLTSGDFLAGASATAINKLVIGEIEKIAGKDPAMMQWLSAALGGVISELTSNNAQVGASAAASGTKNNYLFLDQRKQRDEELRLARERGASAEEIKAIEDKWAKIDAAQDEALAIFGYPAGEILEGTSPRDIEMQNNVKKHAQWLLLNEKTRNGLQKAIGAGASGLIAGVVDDDLSNKIISNIKEKVRINANAQGLPYLNYVVDIPSGGSFVMKGVAKVGVIDFGATVYSVYLNGENYNNMSDFAKASAVDIVGLGVATIGTIGVGALTSNAAALVIGGVVVGFIVDNIASRVKPEVVTNGRD